MGGKRGRKSWRREIFGDRFLARVRLLVGTYVEVVGVLGVVAYQVTPRHQTAKSGEQRTLSRRDQRALTLRAPLSQSSLIRNRVEWESENGRSYTTMMSRAKIRKNRKNRRKGFEQTTPTPTPTQQRGGSEDRVL